MVASFAVDVDPVLLNWVAERVGWSSERLHERFPDFHKWQLGIKKPTFKQLEKFAKAAHAPLGYLFLDEPIVENVPIPDFRTLGNAGIARPSPDLLDVVSICQTRQDWYRQFAISRDLEPLAFVGSVTTRNPVVEVASQMRSALNFEIVDRGEFTNWEDAYRHLIGAIEDLGALVMVSGIVEGDTTRPLDPEEFRGFALSDTRAPVIFVNGADSKAAQIFTLVHEFAHLWLGETALSDAKMVGRVSNESEMWCNGVSAEVLVPLNTFGERYRGNASSEELDRLARSYRVSTLMILKRIFDAGFLTREEFSLRYEEELSRVMEIVRLRRQNPGGNYYRTQPLRLSRQFARAVIIDTFEGRTLHRDAFSLLGTVKFSTFQRLASELGIN